MNYKFVKGTVALAVLAALSGCNISKMKVSLPVPKMSAN